MMEFGRPFALTEENEKNLMEEIFLSRKWGFPFTLFDVGIIVQSFL